MGGARTSSQSGWSPDVIYGRNLQLAGRAERLRATNLEEDESDAEKEADGATELLLAREEEERLARADDERQTRQEENLQQHRRPGSGEVHPIVERVAERRSEKEHDEGLSWSTLSSATSVTWTHVAERKKDAVEEENDAEQHEQHADTLRNERKAALSVMALDEPRAKSSEHSLSGRHQSLLGARAK